MTGVKAIAIIDIVFFIMCIDESVGCLIAEFTGALVCGLEYFSGSNGITGIVVTAAIRS